MEIKVTEYRDGLEPKLVGWSMLTLNRITAPNKANARDA